MIPNLTVASVSTKLGRDMPSRYLALVGLPVNHHTYSYKYYHNYCCKYCYQYYCLLAGSSVDYDDDEELPPLTPYLVDKALDEVRPYLIADGGNVEVAAVQDGVVMLRLQGACGTCPSSTATMKMGIERSLRVRDYSALPLSSLCDVFVQLPTLSGCKPACHTCCICQQHDDRCIRIIDTRSAQYCVIRYVSRMVC